MKSSRFSLPRSVMFTRRTATVTISAPLSSTAALVSAKSRYLPVPTISRDLNFIPPNSNGVSCIFFLPLSLQGRGSKVRVLIQRAICFARDSTFCFPSSAASNEVDYLDVVARPYNRRVVVGLGHDLAVDLDG